MNFKLGPHNSLIEVSTDWQFGIDGDAKELEKDMIEFMLEANGIGLAANQIGITKRVFVMGSHNIPGFPAPFAVFNPVIKEASTELILDHEGCLSYPGLFLKIKRPSWILAEYQDSDGNVKEIRIDGYISKCFQHEFDHLNGVCFVDKVSALKLQLAMKKIRKNKYYD
jgi:peptide deformylase